MKEIYNLFMILVTEQTEVSLDKDKNYLIEVADHGNIRL